MSNRNMNEIIILSQTDIEKELKDLPGWVQEEDKITKQFEFRNFMDAMNFAYELAPIFEKLEHHADMHILYNVIVFDLKTHDSGGKITNKDIQTAHEIEIFSDRWKK